MGLHMSDQSGVRLDWMSLGLPVLPLGPCELQTEASCARPDPLSPGSGRVAATGSPEPAVTRHGHTTGEHVRQAKVSQRMSPVGRCLQKVGAW